MKNLGMFMMSSVSDEVRVFIEMPNDYNRLMGPLSHE